MNELERFIYLFFLIYVCAYARIFTCFSSFIRIKIAPTRTFKGCTPIMSKNDQTLERKPYKHGKAEIQVVPHIPNLVIK